MSNTSSPSWGSLVAPRSAHGRPRSRDRAERRPTPGHAGCPGDTRGPPALTLRGRSPQGPLLYSGRARTCDRMSGAAPTMNLRPLTVAVVGATGVVGRTMIQILNEREFPVGEVRLLASGRSAGRTVSIEGRTLEIAEAVPDAFEGVDIALFSAGADISKELAPAAVAHGTTVI